MLKRLGVCVLISWLTGLAPAYSQTTGTISGSVTDATGAVLPGTSITILNEDTGISRTLTADSGGRYNAPALSLGRYKVTASLDGFQTSARSGIELTVGRQAVVNFQLQVGAVTQTVEVTGEAPLVEVTKGGLGTLVESNTINELPLNGRDLAQLITLQTGAVEYTSAEREGGKLLVVSGGRPTTNVFMIDGVAIESYTQKTPTGNSGQFLGAEGVREFRVETNSYSAEFGRGSGGIFNIATKSGTNQLHGSLFEYLRNDNLDAAKWEDNKLGEGKPEFKRNQFGGSIGGPIVRDQTFFFGTYEGLRERLGQTLSSDTFLPSERSDSRVLAVVAPYLQLWPLPNGSDATRPRDYIFGFSQPTNENLVQGRVDHKLSDNDNIFARYTFLKSDQTIVNAFPNTRHVLNTKNQSVTLEWSRIITPTILNTARFGFSRNFPDDKTVQDAINPSLFFVPGVDQLGDLSPSGVSGVGDGVTGEYRVLNSFQYVDDVNWTMGRHSMKFGFNWNRIQFNGWNPARDAGNYSFNSINNFLFGQNGVPVVQRFRGSVVPGFNDAFRSFRNNIIALYLQDDIQVTSRFILNAGLRYEFQTIPTENWGRVGKLPGDVTFIQNPSTGLNQIEKGNPWFENPSLRDIAPRLGFAWDVTGSGKMAVRGGFGLFFQKFDQSWFRTSGFRMPPFLIEIDTTAANLPFPNLATVCANEDLTAPVARDPRCQGARPGPDMVPEKFRNAYVIQYNLNVQREVLPNTVVTIGYVGSRGVRLPEVADLNQRVPSEIGGRLSYANTPATRPNGNFGQIRYRHPGASSFYNSLQLNVNRKFAQGLQFNGAYTFSKNIDDISGVQTASDTNSGINQIPNYFIKYQYRGLSSFDSRHVFTFSSTYELPVGPGRMFGSGMSGVAEHLFGGWQLGGIITLSSGFPATVTTSTPSALSNRGHGNVMPDLLPGYSNSPTSGSSLGCGDIPSGTPLGTPDLYFDPCVFAFPPALTLGTLGRNTVIMPGRAVVDFNLTKKFAIGSAEQGQKIEFKFDAFNLFNRPNFGTPARNIMNGSGVRQTGSGQISSTVGSSRQIQLALKYIF